MKTLYLIRHSRTRANEERLYGGSTDIPLSPKGRQLAESMRRERPLPEAALYATSGMARANETLRLLTGRAPGLAMPRLREMDFGAFEMRSYEQLKDVPDYIRWIGDAGGDFPCPGGESKNAVRARVLAGGRELLQRAESSAIVVCHGGAIVNLMEAWFPQASRSFYEWQPAACRGYRVSVEENAPTSFEEV